MVTMKGFTTKNPETVKEMLKLAGLPESVIEAGKVVKKEVE